MGVDDISSLFSTCESIDVTCDLIRNIMTCKACAVVWALRRSSGTMLTEVEVTEGIYPRASSTELKCFKQANGLGKEDARWRMEV